MISKIYYTLSHLRNSGGSQRQITSESLVFILAQAKPASILILSYFMVFYYFPLFGLFGLLDNILLFLQWYLHT